MLHECLLFWSIYSEHCTVSACVNWLQITGLGPSLLAVVSFYCRSHIHRHTHTLTHLEWSFFFITSLYHTLTLLFIVCRCLYPAVNSNTPLPMFLQQWPIEGQSVCDVCVVLLVSVLSLWSISPVLTDVFIFISWTLLFKRLYSHKLPVGVKCHIMLGKFHPSSGFPEKHVCFLESACASLWSAWLHHLLGWLTDLVTERLPNHLLTGWLHM